MEATRESTETLRSLLAQLRRDIDVSGAGRDARPISAEVLAGLVEEVIERREDDETTVVVPEPELVDPGVHAAAMDRADRIARERDDLEVRLVAALRHGEQSQLQRNELIEQRDRAQEALGTARDLTEHYKGIQAELLARLQEAEATVAAERDAAQQYQTQRNDVSNQLNDMTDARDRYVEVAENYRLRALRAEQAAADHEELVEKASEIAAQRDRYLAERDNLRQHLQAEMAEHRKMGERAIDAERRLAVLADEKAAMQRRAEAAEEELGDSDALRASLDIARENLGLAERQVATLLAERTQLQKAVKLGIEAGDRLERERDHARDVAEHRSDTITELERQRNNALNAQVHVENDNARLRAELDNLPDDDADFRATTKRLRDQLIAEQAGHEEAKAQAHYHADQDRQAREMLADAMRELDAEVQRAGSEQRRHQSLRISIAKALDEDA